jgi:hypothetical protein
MMTGKCHTKANPINTAEWAHLTPAQKRARRINRWQSSVQEINFVNPAAQQKYLLQLQRLIDVLNVEEPDRVPVGFHLAQIPFKLAGISFHNGIYDYQQLAQVYDWFNTEHAAELECFIDPMLTPPGKVLDILDYKLYVWPGHGLPIDATEIQYVEGEYMMPDEYDHLILNPSDFWMRIYLPRVFGAFESFKKLNSLTDIIEFPVEPLSVLKDRQLRLTLQKLLDAGQEMEKRAEALDRFGKRGRELGYPNIPGCLGLAPFDIIGDTLRGTRGIMMDMYRQPDKLLEALNIIADLMIKSIIEHSSAEKGLMASFPLHKGADGWMSQKQFEKFYWPSLKKVMNAVINEGMIVSLFAEGSYNTRLEIVNEFPKGSVTWVFDQTDMAKAKKILGNKCCIQGNVPSSLMITGTPRDVMECSRKLIEVCGKGGGYILTSGTGTTEMKLENLKAMVEAAKKYGVYQK